MGNNYVSLGEFNYLGRLIDYELDEKSPSFIEQSKMDNKIVFMDWDKRDLHFALDDNTLVLWYEKGKRPPFSHKRNDQL